MAEAIPFNVLQFGAVEQKVNKTQAQEAACFEGFQAAYADFPKTLNDTIHDDKPDFRLHLSDGFVIGVEITEYVRGQNANKGGSLLRQVAKFRESIIKECQDEFNRTRNEPLWVSISWINSEALVNMNRTEKGRFVQKAVSLVAKFCPVEDDLVLEWDDFSESDIESLVASIHISNLGNGKSIWSANGAAWVGLSIEEIIGIINEKENKAREYRKSCDELWLLICADVEHDINLTSVAMLPHTYQEWSFKTDFDRVLFYNHLTKRVWELKR